MEVLDGEGKVKRNHEAVDVWCNHFSRLLGGADESSCGGGGIGTKKSDFDNQLSLDFSGRLCSPIIPEEVHWALDKVKKDAAPGSRCFGADTIKGIPNVLWHWNHAP